MKYTDDNVNKRFENCKEMGKDLYKPDKVDQKRKRSIRESGCVNQCAPFIGRAL